MGRFFVLIIDSACEFIKLQAWLNSTPEKDDKTRRELNKDSSLLLIEPEFHWLIDNFLECGLSLNVIPWTEIQAWQTVTKKQNIWLAKTVRYLSEFYITMFNQYNNSTQPAPVQAEIEEQRKAVATQFNKIFRG